MANFKTHLIAGAAVGVALNLVKQSAQIALVPKRPFSWDELLAWGAIGAAAASLPDLLEPALNPFHRRFFHSITVACLILFAIFGKPSRRLAAKTREIIALTGFSYISHLALDIITPMGLPFI